MPPPTISLTKKRYPIQRYHVLANNNSHAPKQDYLPECRALRLLANDNNDDTDEGTKRFMLVTFDRDVKKETVRRWLEETTKNGMRVGDELFTFLGYTESGLKEGKVIFFREDQKWTVRSLKAYFGDLDEVYLKSGYGKYAARLGLSFSSTKESLEVPEFERFVLEELKALDGSLCSDGCGMIRDSFAKEVTVQLELPEDTTVFQVRLGGIKGTLVRYPDDVFDRKCGRGKKIAYRPSMLKYTKGPTKLEVQNVSKPPRSARLNLQFIYLLLTLGVPASVFEALLRKQLEEIDEILVDREKAMDVVGGEVDSEGDAFYQELWEMLAAGFDIREPHLRSMLEGFQKRILEKLREKLKIQVKNSAYLFGVVDEQDILKPGEVYINLPNRGGPIVGDVVVGRNPAYGVGDLRRLKAVTHSKLSHLKNCIVFAGKGTYSEPDQMGGGDLDGDLYCAIWDEQLIPKRCRPAKVKVSQAPTGMQTRARKALVNVPGFDDVPRSNASGSGRVDQEKMRKDALTTFLELRNGFLLGSICKEWMAHVGSTEKLADSRFCERLVPMIEAALDITKTGTSINKIQLAFSDAKLERDSEKPSPTWADPVLALRAMIPVPAKQDNVKYVCDPAVVVKDLLEDPNEWAELVKAAEKTMREYNMALKYAIAMDAEMKEMNGPDSESFSVDSDDADGLVKGKEADRTKERYKKIHFPPPKNVLEDDTPLRKKASAWYYVGYTAQKPAFAWLGARYLNKMKALSFGIEPLTIGPTKVPLVPKTPDQPAPPSDSASTSQPTEVAEEEEFIVVDPPPKRRRLYPEMPSPPKTPEPVPEINTDDDEPVEPRSNVTIRRKTRKPQARRTVPGAFDAEESSVSDDDEPVPCPKSPRMKAERRARSPAPVRTGLVSPPLTAAPSFSSDTVIDLSDLEDALETPLPPTKQTRKKKQRPLEFQASQDSEQTLVDDPPLPAPSPPSSEATLAPPSQAHVDKPKEPVATVVKACPSSGPYHAWCIKSANRTNRKYSCTKCKVLVSENRPTGTRFWVAGVVVHS